MAKQSAFLSRLRQRRSVLLFSQEELSRMVGIHRISLSKMEIGMQKIPFDVGVSLCRIFNSNPVYLVEGKGETAPWIEFENLGLNEVDVFCCAGAMDFLEGYHSFLKKPFASWIASHTKQEIVDFILRQDPETEIKRSSRRLLLESRSRFQRLARNCPHDAVRKAYTKIVDDATRELKSRGYIKDEKSICKENLTSLEVPCSFPSVESTFSKLMERARALCFVHGRKTELSQALGVSRQMVHSYLAGDSAPSAEIGFLLQKWVKKMEAKEKSQGVLIHPMEMTRTRKPINEPSKSSLKKK